MRTEVVMDWRLLNEVHIIDSLQVLKIDPELRFLQGDMLVVDHMPWWLADFDVIRTALVKKRREFKAPFIEKEPAKDVRKELRLLAQEAETMFPRLYPHWKPGEVRTSFRPMITGPEPLHFDSYGGESMVTAYINVSNEPRIYNVGPSFQSLLRTHPLFLRALAKDHKTDDLSYALRQLTAEDRGPLNSEAPRHRVALAPGAIWFFNAKTVSHEVVYGTGVLGISWEVPGCGIATQADMLKGLK